MLLERGLSGPRAKKVVNKLDFKNNSGLMWMDMRVVFGASWSHLICKLQSCKLINNLYIFKLVPRLVKVGFSHHAMAAHKGF